MTIGIEEDLILPAVAGLSAILIVLFSQFYMLQSTYEDEATVLSSKIRSLYQENDKLEAQIKELKESDPQQVRDLKLQLKLVEDGASIEEAKHILEVSTEAGVSPKFQVVSVGVKADTNNNVPMQYPMLQEPLVYHSKIMTYYQLTRIHSEVMLNVVLLG